jgi:SWI/SNF-related matrix-associated actin-dependent regulator of chromatin subfamily A member 5
MEPFALLYVAGTPLQNNMVELYGMLAFMYPDVFTTPGPFEAAFNLVKGTVSGADGWMCYHRVCMQ